MRSYSRGDGRHALSRRRRGRRTRVIVVLNTVIRHRTCYYYRYTTYYNIYIIKWYYIILLIIIEERIIILYGFCKDDDDVWSVLPSNLVTAPCWLNTWWAISGYPRYLLDSSSSRECCWCCWLAAMAYSSRSVAGDGDGDGDVDGGGLPATAVVMAVRTKRIWQINIFLFITYTLLLVNRFLTAIYTVYYNIPGHHT